MQAYILPVPLAGERLSLALPLDNYRWAYRVHMEPVPLSLSAIVTQSYGTHYRLTLYREKVRKGGLENVEPLYLAGCEGSHYECQTWLAGWLNAMSHMLSELLLAEERGATWMRDHAHAEEDVLDVKALCERERR